MQDIIAETMKCEFFFPNKIDKKIYSKIELALKGFFNILALIKESDLKILVVPSSLKPQELMLNQNFIKFLAKKVGSTKHSLEMLRGLGNAAGAYHCYKVILLLDFVNVATVRHEIFHHLHENILNRKTKIEISRLFDKCLSENRVVTKNQLNNVKEYFASAGEYYLGKGFYGLLSGNKKLKKKDPEIYDLINRILAGDTSLF